jgi:hypothetical protein
MKLTMSRADSDLDHAANDSPRSGSSKRMTPVVWCVIVAVIVAVAVYYAMGA